MNQIDLVGNTQQQLSVSAVAAATPVLDGKYYDIWCTVDVYVAVGTDVSGVTSSNGYLIRAGESLANCYVDGRKIGAISASAGTMSYHRVG